MRTRAKYFGFELVLGHPEEAGNGEYFGALFQYPGEAGDLIDLTPHIAAVKAKGAVAVVATDIMALVALKSPGEMGADVAIGNTQRFGVPMGFGGPHAAYFAFKDEMKRSAPGRIIGVSVDAKGKTALRMALQTREQHIRREKANSNICTSQVLLANIAGMYAVYHGPEGVKRIAARIHRLAPSSRTRSRPPAASWCSTASSIRCRLNCPRPMPCIRRRWPPATICAAPAAMCWASPSTRRPARPTWFA